MKQIFGVERKSMQIINESQMSILGRIKKCIFFAPLPVITLFIYMALRSSAIFPEGVADIAIWHKAYIGWYDFLLASSLVVSFFINGFRIGKENFIFILFCSFVISVSFINTTLGFTPVLDGFAYLLRFALVFSFVVWLVDRLGVYEVESLIISLFGILAVTALFVYSLQFGSFNRMYSSGMSVAGFGQVSAVVCLIAFTRKYKLVFLISICFLFMTFSRTSCLLFVFLFCTYLFFAKNISVLEKIKFSTVISLIVVFGVFYLVRLNEYMDIFRGLTDPEEIKSFSGRTDIWSYAIDLLLSGHIPVFGVGFNMAPSLLNDFYIEMDNGHVSYYSSFHSILIEYIFGFGILSIVIFYYLFKRIWQTFYFGCYPACFIFFLFFMSQNLDFTFYRPKEVVIWAAMLGLAEGQWRSIRNQRFYRNLHNYRLLHQ